jgi:hypothetical protein
VYKARQDKTRFRLIPENPKIKINAFGTKSALYLARMEQVVQAKRNIAKQNRRNRRKWGAKLNGKYELTPCLANRPSGVPEIEKMVQMKLVRSAGTSVSDSFTALSMVAQQTSVQRRQRKKAQEGLPETTDRPSPNRPRWANVNATKAKAALSSPVDEWGNEIAMDPSGRPRGRNRKWQNEAESARKQLQHDFRAEKNRVTDEIQQNRSFHKTPQSQRPVFEMYHEVSPKVAAMKEATRMRSAIEEAARNREEERQRTMRQGHSGKPNDQEFDTALGPAALEYEKAKALKNTRAHVAKVDDFLSSLPPLGV